MEEIEEVLSKFKLFQLEEDEESYIGKYSSSESSSKDDQPRVRTNMERGEPSRIKPEEREPPMGWQSIPRNLDESIPAPSERRSFRSTSNSTMPSS